MANEAVAVALLVFAELEHPTPRESYSRKRRSDRESYSVEECVDLELAPSDELGRLARNPILLVVIALVVLGLIVLFAWAFVGSGAWKAVVGFLIFATVVVAISKGVRQSGDR